MLAGWLFARDGDLSPQFWRIATLLSSLLGREISLEGDLRLTLTKSPVLRITRIRVTNAPWARPRSCSRRRWLRHRSLSMDSCAAG